jgi:hypothetical protein
VECPNLFDRARSIFHPLGSSRRRNRSSSSMPRTRGSSSAPRRRFSSGEFGPIGIPWNNNNAEHAVKSFAELRQTIGGVTREKGLRDYLVLLSLCQTCRYIGLDFLDFLCSGEKDLRAFADSRRRKDKPCVAPTVSTRRRIVSPSRNSTIDEFKSAAQNRAR